MVVVLPTPLTPMTRITLGWVDRFSSVSPTESMSTRISFSASRASSVVFRCCSRTALRSRPTALTEVSTPKSARIRLSSSSS